MTSALDPLATAPNIGKILICGPLAHRATQIGLTARKETIAHLTIGRQPCSVTCRAKRARNRSDDTDFTAVTGLPFSGLRVP